MKASMEQTLNDPLAALAPHALQREAARLAQEAFALAFRQTLEGQGDERPQVIAQIVQRLMGWANDKRDSDGEGHGARHLRQAMLLSGLDQWGLAYSQVYGPAATTGLSALVAGLRAGLDGAGENEGYQAFFERLDREETAAFSFKSDLRQGLHLALWHTMIATENRGEALQVLQQLGGMMLSLPQAMPQYGWMILANTLADIQIRCLAHALAAEGLGQEMTQELFGALSRQLPEEQRQQVMGNAARTVLEWQQSNRAQGTVH
jgi:hypothetical protein